MFMPDGRELALAECAVLANKGNVLVEISRRIKFRSVRDLAFSATAVLNFSSRSSESSVVANDSNLLVEIAGSIKNGVVSNFAFVTSAVSNFVVHAARINPLNIAAFATIGWVNIRSAIFSSKSLGAGKYCKGDK
jgi:hypothetical protein